MNKIFKFRFFGIVAFLAMTAVFSVAAMFLWNALIPDIFGLPALNCWQAAGLVILARILFGGPGGLRHFGRRGHGGYERLFRNENSLREKWPNMSGDERKEFLRSRGGFPHAAFFGENFGGKDAPGSEEGKRE